MLVAAGGLDRGPLAAPGYPLVALAGALSLCFWLVDVGLAAAAGVAATVFLAYFFRNPKRIPPHDLAAVVSPADGRVLFTDELREERFLHGPAKRLAIFMNIFDVHVNRAPATARVLRCHHQPGRFLAAFDRGAEKVNEQLAILWENPAGERLLTVQIAGILARRILWTVKEGEVLPQGRPFGMICFGSRVDLYLPLGYQLLVKAGDRVQAGQTIVARRHTHSGGGKP